MSGKFVATKEYKQWKKDRLIQCIAELNAKIETYKKTGDQFKLDNHESYRDVLVKKLALL